MNNDRDCVNVGFCIESKDAVMPAYSHVGDSGMDVSSCEYVTVKPGDCATVRTGVSAELPDGYEIQVRPRSGLSKKGIVAAFGTVDSGYRGEIMVTIHNLSFDDYHIRPGDRIAQFVVAKVERVKPVVISSVRKDTDRGCRGFGSTGV